MLHRVEFVVVGKVFKKNPSCTPKSSLVSFLYLLAKLFIQIDKITNSLNVGSKRSGFVGVCRYCTYKEIFLSVLTLSAPGALSSNDYYLLQ